MAPKYEPPDTTPPFLSADLIRGWINGAVSEERELQHKAELDRLRQMHAIELQMRSLAGDGLTDIGSVGRMAKVLEGFIAEQREANVKAERDVQASKKQLNEIKQIPRIIRDLWKLVVALIGGAVLIMTLWSKLHPPQVKITPQQIEQLKENR